VGRRKEKGLLIVFITSDFRQQNLSEETRNLVGRFGILLMEIGTGRLRNRGEIDEEPYEAPHHARP